jgi:Papain family cysteine protease
MDAGPLIVVTASIFVAMKKEGFMPPIENGWGLGANPSPFDPRDYPLFIPNTVAMPSRFVLTSLGPVLNQGKTGTCVAHAADAIRMWQERRDNTPISTWVTEPAVFRLYDLCKALDGELDPKREFGTSLRTVLRVLRLNGTPLAPPMHNGGRIAAYYRIDPTVTLLKQALMQHGALLVACAWDVNWFKVPTSLVLKPPLSEVAGGHAFMFWGWDDNVNGGSWLMRNSWGRGIGGWTPTGNAYMAYRYFDDIRGGRTPEAWWIQDIIGDPIT